MTTVRSSFTMLSYINCYSRTSFDHPLKGSHLYLDNRIFLKNNTLNRFWNSKLDEW